MAESEDLDKVRSEYERLARLTCRRVIVCAGAGCVANGAMRVMAAFAEKIKASGLRVCLELREETPAKSTFVSRSGCQGFCQMGPLVTIEPEGILYTKVGERDVTEIVARTLVRSELVERLLYVEPSTGVRCKGIDGIPFYQRQNRMVLGQCGHIDPEDIREYVALGGYEAARRAFVELSAEAVCGEIRESGLRGRETEGKLAADEWDDIRTRHEKKKYVVCNGYEGDPGAFVLRFIMEGNPHGIVEGMLITARAIGAEQGIIYLRSQHTLAVNRLRKAIDEAERRGVVGKNVFGSGRGFQLKVLEGTGHRR